jgi:hypothetical protein
MTLQELKNLKIVDLRLLNISDAYKFIIQNYPAQCYQSFSHESYNLMTDKDIQEFKVKALKNHAVCMTIDNYGLTAYVPHGIELKV